MDATRLSQPWARMSRAVTTVNSSHGIPGPNRIPLIRPWATLERTVTPKIPPSWIRSAT